MRLFILILSFLIFPLAQARETIEITPENASEHRVIHYVSNFGFNKKKHVFMYPETMDIDGEVSKASSIAQIAYVGQEDLEGRHTVAVPQGSNYSVLIGDDDGLSVSFITVTYTAKKQIKMAYLIKLVDWVDNKEWPENSNVEILN